MNLTRSLNRIASNCICAFIPDKSARRKVKALFGIYRPPVRTDHYGSRKIHFNEEAQDLILKTLQTQQPCLIARFGATEYRAFNEYRHIQKGLMRNYGKKTKRWMNELSGFFPSDTEHLNKFCSMLKTIIANADIMALWFKHDEQEIMDEFCPNAEFVELSSMSPVYQTNPWSTYLDGKKVLIIHPFEASIRAQYAKRELLFPNTQTLPEFELKTLKAVQSLADNKQKLPFKDWFEALDSMKNEIVKIDFDIAIIGAGAYGIFLADYCKQLGKQAIHLAGETQVLFGITGKRWIKQNRLNEISNEHWILPSENEKPLGAEKVEGSCYW